MLCILVPWAAYSIALTLIRPTITRRTHERVSNGSSQDFASVDVFIMTCGEDLDVLSNTFRHVSALRWRGGCACMSPMTELAPMCGS